MPLYEYKCRKCDTVFEVMQKFADAPLETHADCGGAVERLISSSAFQFKGSGFYITDYAKSRASKGDSKKTETKTEAPKTEAPKADAKPAEKK
jgi:putative FmdB family regulatory protein